MQIDICSLKNSKKITRVPTGAEKFWNSIIKLENSLEKEEYFLIEIAF